MAADIMPWAAPDSTLAIATSQIGQGACTRSSISRVKPNSCAMASAIDCTPWNMTEIPTTPGHQDGRERGLGRRAVPADALADLREDVQEDEAQQERLDDRAQHELPQVLAQHHQVAQQQRAQRGPARGGHRPGRAAADPPGRRLRWSPMWRHSVPQLLPGQVDEHRLQAGLGDRQVEQVEPAALGRRARCAGPAGRRPARAARRRRPGGGSG